MASSILSAVTASTSAKFSKPRPKINFEDRNFAERESHQQFLLILGAVIFVLANGFFFRLVMVLSRGKTAKGKRRPESSTTNPTHLLVVLGSGGHTAEMLNMLEQVPNVEKDYTHRTYVVSSGDDFSALKASEFEKELGGGQGGSSASYDIVTVRRARRVHQSIYTTPFTAIVCLWDCLKVLRGEHADQRNTEHIYPDLILTNGPGTGVCVVLASIILLFFGLSGQPKGSASAAGAKPYKGAGQMRTIFIESWARVKTLSLSGQILKPLVDRFLVQWPQLVEEGGRVEYAGALVA